jgi:hypothetical protein
MYELLDTASFLPTKGGVGVEEGKTQLCDAKTKRQNEWPT